MKLRPKITLIEHFDKLNDPRIDRTKDHKLIDIVIIAICGVICGADSWVGIESYGKSKYKWLKQFLELPNGIPSHDTFARVFARLDPEEFQNSFISWVKSLSEHIFGEVIGIDGKTLRHSYDRGANKGAIHMVSAWASSQRLILGQRKVEDKSNEITAIPKLIQVLELNGCIVTIDAMGCQKEIARLLISKGADYCLCLKGNQGNIHEDVEQLFKQAIANQWKGIEHSFYQTIEKGHGRIEIRRYWTMAQTKFLIDSEQWTGLQSIGMVESVRKIGSEITTEVRYFLNSFESDAQVFAHAARSHWQIENCLHWCLDVAFREDNCRIRKDYAPQNLAVVRHIALNLLSREGTEKMGMGNKRLKAGWDNDYLVKILTA
jgi:predicted transposase YbfD/YdcC